MASPINNVMAGVEQTAAKMHHIPGKIQAFITPDGATVLGAEDAARMSGLGSFGAGMDPQKGAAIQLELIKQGYKPYDMQR